MKFALVLALSSVCAYSQNMAVRTHGSAKTEEFLGGCPANWPAYVADIGSSTNLPAGCKPEDGWEVWTVERYDATRAELAPLKDAFDKVWKEKIGPGRSWTALEFNKRIKRIAPDALDAIDDLIANVDTPPALRRQLRQLNRMLTAAQDINSKDPDTVSGINAVVSLGIISQKQADDILKGP